MPSQTSCAHTFPWNVLQYIRFNCTHTCGKHEISSVYYKRTHGSRPEHLQSLWGGHYNLRISGWA